MYYVDTMTLKLFIFILVLNRTTDKWSKPGSKKQSGKEIEILICGRICCITLHFSKKRMKKYASYNPRQVMFSKCNIK